MGGANLILLGIVNSAGQTCATILAIVKDLPRGTFIHALVLAYHILNCQGAVNFSFRVD